MTAARLSKEDWKAEQKKKQGALEEQLNAFLMEAMTTENGLKALTDHYKISGLYGYSLYNNILIHMQGGTIAQSYAKWKNLGRCVSKGTKSNINIFVPLICKKKNPITGLDESVCFGFKMGAIFDISQTEGKELEYDHNSEETDHDYDTIKAQMEELCGVKAEEEITGLGRGYSDGSKLVVSSMSNTTDKIKSLAHEVGHHLLHTGKNQNRNEVDHETREVEAESVSHLVCSYLDLPYELSAAYVASYKQGITKARIKRVVGAADKIIKALRG